MVCPDCGGSEFYADHSAVVRREYTVGEDGYVNAGEDTTQDIDRDYDYLTCDDCGAEHAPEDLVTQEAYDDVEEASWL